MKLYDIFIVLFGVIGAFNLGAGVLLTLEKITEKLSAKWFYIYIISTTLGVVALKIIIENKGA